MKKIIIITASVLVVVIIGLAAGMGVLFSDKTSTPQEPAMDEQERAALAFRQIEAEAYRLSNSGNIEGAAQKIRQQSNFEESEELHWLLATTYLNAGKGDEALNAFLQIENKFGLTYTLAEHIGDNYVAKGDKEKARQYYERALNLLQSKDVQYMEGDPERIKGKLSSL